MKLLIWFVLFTHGSGREDNLGGGARSYCAYKAYERILLESNSETHQVMFCAYFQQRRVSSYYAKNY